MSWILLSNDDGVDSPALVPFADALETVLGLPVRIAVPDGERSWSGKALSRHGRVDAVRVRRGRHEVLAVAGTPADAVQIALHGGLGAEFAVAPPQAVVTGVNLGFNHGTGFLASSGTVWAAAEAALAGLPAVAVSTGAGSDFAAWRSAALEPASAADWSRVAAVAAEVVHSVGDSDLVDHCDVVSINLPWDATAASPRRVTELTPLSYGPLFVPEEDGWRFTTELAIQLGETEAHGDVATVVDGAVSITPVLLPRSAAVPERTRARLERG